MNKKKWMTAMAIILESKGVLTKEEKEKLNKEIEKQKREI